MQTAQSIYWEKGSEKSVAQPRRSVLNFYYFVDQSLKVITGAVTAFAVIIGTVLAINEPGLVLYVQVTVCTAGLVFFGLATEAEKVSTSWLCLATGLALPALAYLSQNMGPEWLIVAAGLVAAWIAAAFCQSVRIARR